MASTDKSPGIDPDMPDAEDSVKAEEVLQKFDPESRYLKVTGLWARIVKVVAIFFSLFQLYTGLFGVFEAQIQRPTHLMFALALVFILYPLKKRVGRETVHPVDLVLAAMSVAATLYSILNYEDLMESAGLYSGLDYAVSVVGILLTLEATRRIVGLPIVFIAGIFLIYAYFGAHFPGFMSHRGYDIKRIATHMWFTTEGILGVPLGVSANFIFLFILFGAFLMSTGIMEFFMDLAYAVAGWASGGPAKIAVITSAFEGTVSGSSVANTVGSGSFTIPLMKRLGYRPEFAGAVEAAASTGGQIMPPIMGAAAFLMAEFINMPYIEIAKAAVIPALLYFTGVFVVIHLEAKKCGLKGLGRDQLPHLGKVMKERSYLILPLVGIIYFLLEGATPMRAAMSGLGLCVLVGMFRKETRLNLKKLLDTLESGARSALGVAVACATAGIIVGVVTLTGLGLKMGDGLIAIAGGLLLPTLFFTMITSLVLGMGAPTTANYVITSTVAAPALVKLGTPPVAAHMFTFYFGIVADITPPVALAAMAGAAIAKSNPWWTGVQASKIAIAAFIIPYVFVFSPALVLVDASIPLVGQMLMTSVVGMIGVGAAVEGWYWTRMAWWERIAALAAGLMLIDPATVTDVTGLGIMGLLTIFQYRKAWQQRAKTRKSQVPAENQPDRSAATGQLHQ
jgi:TRAP transporter 4TM/12TM fusion protein